MDELRRWVLMLCCGCVFYGMLENLLPRRGAFPVIKAVAVLYIMLMLLSPVGKLRPDKSFLPDLSVSSGGAVLQQETDGFTQSAADVLRYSLVEALKAEDVGATLQEVRLQCSGNEIRSVHLVFQVLSEMTEEDKLQIQQFCDGLLGMEGAYEWREG